MQEPKKLSYSDIRKIFLKIAEDIEKDRTLGTYQSRYAQDVSFLSHEPIGTKEIAENIFERLRCFGVDFYADPNSANPEDIFQLYLARKDANERSL